MRSDSIGIFWQDTPRKKGDKVARVMPPIPETGWTVPTHLPDLSAARALSIDVETYDPGLAKGKNNQGPGWARGKGHICGIAVGTDDGFRAYYPIRHTIEKETNLDPEHVIRWAADQFSNPRQPKIGANLTYDVGWLRQEGIFVRGDLFDVQFAEALLTEAGDVNLDHLGAKYLGEHKTTHLLYDWCAAYYGGTTKDQRKNIYRAPPSLVGPYAEGDVDLPFKVMNAQWPLLMQQGLIDVFLMECQLIPLMIEMRFAGVTVDIPRAEQLRDRMIAENKELEKQLAQEVGFHVDVWAATSLAKAFDKLGIQYSLTKKAKKPSFTAAYLEKLEHPIGQLIRNIRKRDKLRKTFIEGYILNAHIDGKVYGSFNQLRGDDDGTRSGRYSSSHPNLQNIPVRSELGKEMRRIFVPDPGHWRWRKHDYSQIEYRGLAHYAVGPGSDEVRRLYNEDPSTDFHELVKQLILQITGLDLERPFVKNINFGTVYGMGEPGLARYLKLALNVSKKLFAAIHEGAPFLKATMNATMEEADRLGYITTILGRRSRFDLWVPGTWSEEGKTERPLPYNQAILQYPNPRRAYLHKALNRRLQGTAAEILKTAMLRCWKDGVFDRTGVPRLTVHDELDFSDPGGQDEAFAEMIHIMETALPLNVPIIVGNEIGPNWGDVKEIAA